MGTVDHRNILLNIYRIIQHSLLSVMKFHEVIRKHIFFLTRTQMHTLGFTFTDR